MTTWLRAIAVSILAVSVVPVAQAQEPEGEAPPPHLAYADGVVDLELDGQVEPATPSTALLAGDRVRTRNGRAEIVYADGTVVHLDRDTAIEVMSPTRLRLTGGRLVVRTSAALSDAFVVDTAAASIEMSPRGEYGVTMDERRRDLSLAVARGLADAETWSGRLVVRAGERADVPDSGAARLYAYNSARFDAFERWSAERVNAFTTAASAAQLPYELRAHGPVMDQYGTWGHVPTYGSVWFPRVGPTWRPYFEGRWRHTRYGWTWIGYDPWAWPTHHYGRWGFSGGVWFWIPARVWAPAWVSWAYAPSYVSWAPLGWDGRPVLALSLRIGGYDPWRAWTVLPSHRLGHRGNLRPWVVDGGRLPHQVRSGFQVRTSPVRSLSVDRGVRSVGADRFVRSDRSVGSVRSVESDRGRVGGTTRPERSRPVRAGRSDGSDRQGTSQGAPIRSPQRVVEDVRSGRAGAAGAAELEPAPQRRFESIRSGEGRPGQIRAPRSGDVQSESMWPGRSGTRPSSAEVVGLPRPQGERTEAGGGRTSGSVDGVRDRGGRGMRPSPGPARTEPAPQPRRESAAPPPARGGDEGRRAVPRGETRGGREGGRSVSPSPTPRGESGARTRPGAVRRPPS